MMQVSADNKHEIAALHTYADNPTQSGESAAVASVTVTTVVPSEQKNDNKDTTIDAKGDHKDDALTALQPLSFDVFDEMRKEVRQHPLVEQVCAAAEEVCATIGTGYDEKM